MALNRRWPLSARIVGVALLNVCLIVTILILFARWQFGWNLEAIALAPAQSRVRALANDFVRDLAAIPYESRDELLAEYSRRYGVDVMLVGPRGNSYTSTPVTLPTQLLERLGRPP